MEKIASLKIMVVLIIGIFNLLAPILVQGFNPPVPHKNLPYISFDSDGIFDFPKRVTMYLRLQLCLEKCTISCYKYN